MNEAPSKPDYLGLLNGISVAEHNAGLYFQAWAEVTPNADLRCALALVAQRETTHGEVFRQRIERLGFALREKEDPTLADKMRVYGDAALSDEEKIRYGRGGGGEQENRDPLAGLEARINDSMDPLTRDTMRWYLAEERDTGRLLREAYAAVTGKSNGSSSGPSADTQALMDCMSQGFASLQQSIAGLVEVLGKPARAK